MKHFRITIWGEKEVEQKLELVIEAPDDATIDDLEPLDSKRLAELCPYWEKEWESRVKVDDNRTSVSEVDAPRHVNILVKWGQTGLIVEGTDGWADV